MQTILTIGGVSYTPAQRAAAQIEIDSWGWDLESDLSAEFHETRTGSMQPRFHCGQQVTMTVDTPSPGTPVFLGEIVSVIPSFPQTGWMFSYRCMGPKYQASGTYVTNVDGTGLAVYNLPPDDPDYIPANSGLSVGTIIGDLLMLSATPLTALGITTDATTTSQLATLTVVPNVAVYLSGRVFQAIDNLLANWARNVHCYVTPSGFVRFWDTTAGNATSLTLGTDPVDPPCFKRDVTPCASRVVVRGKGKIYPGYVSLGRGTLTKAWTTAQQNAWKYTDFTQPNDGYDSGTITTVNSSTQVTVQSSNGSESWAVNFWNQREAWIYLMNSLGSLLTYQESRPVTACSALTAGGTATISFSLPLDNAGSSAYNQYQLIGKVDDLTGGSANNRNDVWRLYNVADPGGLIGDHMVAKFPVPVPFANYTGTAIAQTNYPVAAIVNGLESFPATFSVMPLTGQILFQEPVVKAINTIATLNTGGAGVTAPTDIEVLLAYSRGALTSTYPPDVGGVPQYGGTSYTVDGIQFTQYIDVEAWVYQGNQSLMDQYSQMMWQSMSDTVVTGTVNYRGAWTAAMAGPNLKLNIFGNGFTTGMESLGVPIKSFTLRYHPDGRGGMNYSSQAGVSSRRNPRTGDTLYMHLTTLAQTGFHLNFAEGIQTMLGSGGQYQQMLGASLGLTKSKDLEKKDKGEHKDEKERQQSGQEAAQEFADNEAMLDMMMGGLDEDIPGRDPSMKPGRKRKKKLKPRRKKKYLSRDKAMKALETPTSPDDGDDPMRYGSTPAEARPASNRTKRRKQAKRPHPEIQARYDAGERAARQPYVPEQVHGGPSGQAGIPIPSKKERRRQRAKDSRKGVSSRHDDPGSVGPGRSSEEALGPWEGEWKDE